MLAYFLLAAVVLGWFGLVIHIRNRYGHEKELGERFNNVAWNIAVYGTDEQFRDELKHWRWKRSWKQKLVDLRRRRIEIAEYWAAKKVMPA
ncbi:MAG: hypothetical protein ABSH08_03205 [Tepidisphaeraceae bacterium]|jgi:hypothetical protein